jgi:PAS domain S-box-containing protein
MRFLFGTQENILDTLPDAVFALNYERRFLFCNKAMENLVGYSSKEIKDMHIAEICREGAEAIYGAMIKDHKNTINVRTKHGKDIILEITAYDIEDKQEIIVCARDVTETHTIISNVIAEYKANQEKIEKQNAFIADVAQEFEKPMNSVIGFSQALLEGVGGELNEKQNKYINIIAKNAVTLNNLINAVVDISKFDANKVPVEKKLFDITSVINFVSQAFKPYFEKKNIEFKIKFNELEKRQVYTDEKLLRKILSIIIDNACKFTTTGEVEVVVTNPDLTYARLQGLFIGLKELPSSYVMFKIKDPGSGIKEDDLNLIFDEYSIVEKTRKTVSEQIGTGLNLPIAKKIIDSLGGIIWVESAVDQGSSFNFIIPVKQEVQESTEAENE